MYSRLTYIVFWRPRRLVSPSPSQIADGGADRRAKVCPHLLGRALDTIQSQPATRAVGSKDGSDGGADAVSPIVSGRHHQVLRCCADRMRTTAERCAVTARAGCGFVRAAPRRTTVCRDAHEALDIGQARHQTVDQRRPLPVGRRQIPGPYALWSGDERAIEPALEHRRHVEPPRRVDEHEAIAPAKICQRLHDVRPTRPLKVARVFTRRQRGLEVFVVE
eukprot:6803049-Prymnesium_polylepis.1